MNKLYNINIGSSIQVGNGMLKRSRNFRKKKIRRKLLNLYFKSIKNSNQFFKNLIGGGFQNYYNFITDPYSKKIYNINSKQGKTLLFKYIS